MASCALRATELVTDGLDLIFLGTHFFLRCRRFPFIGYDVTLFTLYDCFTYVQAV